MTKNPKRSTIKSCGFIVEHSRASMFSCHMDVEKCDRRQKLFLASARPSFPAASDLRQSSALVCFSESFSNLIFIFGEHSEEELLSIVWVFNINREYKLDVCSGYQSFLDLDLFKLGCLWPRSTQVFCADHSLQMNARERREQRRSDRWVKFVLTSISDRELKRLQYKF